MNKKILSQLFFSILIVSSCLAYAGKKDEEGKEKTEQKVENNQNPDFLEHPVSQDQAQQNADNAADSPQDVKSDQKKEEPEQKTLIQNLILQKASSTDIALKNLDTKKEFVELIQSPHFMLKVLSFLKDSQDFISLAQTNRAINRVICFPLSDSKEHLISELKKRLNPETADQRSSFNLFRGSLMARHHFLIPALQSIGWNVSADPDRKHFIQNLIKASSEKETSFPHICKRSPLVLSIDNYAQLSFLTLLDGTDRLYEYCKEEKAIFNYEKKIADLGLPLVTSEVSLLENKILLPQIVQFVCTLGVFRGEGILHKKGHRSDVYSVEKDIQKIINIVNENNIQVSLNLIRPSKDQFPLLQALFKTKKVAELYAGSQDLMDEKGCCRFDLSFIRSFRVCPTPRPDLSWFLPFVSEQMKHLQVLNIFTLRPTNQFYDAIKQFAQNRFPYLQELTCPFFAQNDLKTGSFFRLFPSKLRHLNLGQYPYLSQEQVKPAIDHFESLESLGFILGLPDTTEDYRTYIVSYMNHFSKYEKSLMHLDVTFHIPDPKRKHVTQSLEMPKTLMSEQSTTKKWLFANVETLDFLGYLSPFFSEEERELGQIGVSDLASLENVKTVIELCNPKALRKISFGSKLFSENLPFLEKMIEPLPSKFLIFCEDLRLFFGDQKEKEIEEKKLFYKAFLEKYPRLSAQLRIAGRTLAEYCSRQLSLK